MATDGGAKCIVSVEWLHDKIEKGNMNNIRILDVTLGGKEKYEKYNRFYQSFKYNKLKFVFWTYLLGLVFFLNALPIW